jgi:asparaginyl-tRNA synthetase
MEEMGIPYEALTWYADLRRFGSVKHAGFGVGLERLIMYLTGIGNIRDTIPYPRTPGNLTF